MVRAWYMDNDPTDHRKEHHRNPPKFIDVDELFKLTGVELIKLNSDTCLSDGTLDKVKKERGYQHEGGAATTKEWLESHQKELKTFYEEHLHSIEEPLFVIDGSGYFDVRDRNDEWIRIELVRGDMIVIPSGIYHRFTLDEKNFISTRQFFVGEPILQHYNRPADDLDARKEYLSKLKAGKFVARKI